jgi:glycosyltransferase involved in cell wall biosynthesis
MNILHIVGGLPSEEKPHNQPFIKAQVDSLIAKGINIEILDLKGYESAFNYINSKGHIRKVIKQKKINIIHAHYSYCNLSVMLAKTNIPVVLSLMGSDLLGTSNLNGKITFRGHFDKYLTRLVARFANVIIVKSEMMKSKLKTKKPVYVIPNGVNFDFFKPLDTLECRKKLNLNLNVFYVLFLANPERLVKNYTLAKKSIEIFKKKYDVKDIQLLAIYDIPHNQIVKYLNACNVLVFTSFREGSPNVVKEAMACNLPVISTDVGDVAEVISGTKNCFVANYDAEVIAQKLKIIYDNRQRSDGRERIQHLRDDVIAEKLISLYRQILSSKGIQI